MTKRSNIKPVFSLIAVMSLDGKITKHGQPGSHWGSREDKVFLHKILATFDVIIVGNTTYKDAIKPLSKRNCLVFTSSVTTTRQENRRCLYCNPKNVSILSLLKEKGYQKIALLGGSHTYSYFLKKRLIDEIYLTIEPVVFGTGLSLFQNAALKRFRLQTVRKLNPKGTLLLQYQKV